MLWRSCMVCQGSALNADSQPNNVCCWLCGSKKTLLHHRRCQSNWDRCMVRASDGYQRPRRDDCARQDRVFGVTFGLAGKDSGQ